MKKIIFAICMWTLFLSAMLFIPVAGSAGLPVPPPLVIPAPPPVFVIPGTYAYFAPDVDAELFFFGGFWYRPHGGHWYRASHYGGPWGHLVLKKVPGALINLAPGYRNVPPGHQRITHTRLKKNWKKWKRIKYWDRPASKQKHGKKKSHTGGMFKHGPGKGHGKGRGR